MKKILLMISVFALGFTLQACNDANTNISATIEINEEEGIQINQATFNVTVVDPDFEITGNVYVYLSNSLVTVDTKTYSSLDSISVVKFSNLTSETEYTMEIQATVGRETLTVETYTFMTLAQSSLDIETPEDFLAMSNNRSGNYVLKNDIDFSGIEFVTPFTSSFIGSFEGNGFTLSNIIITESRLYNGVFGYISSGKVKNVVIDNLQIGSAEAPIQTSSSTKTGFLTGYQASSLSVIENVTIKNSNLYLESASSTYVYVGGIAGEARGRIENVTIENSAITLTSTSNAIVRLGGGIGYGYESLVSSKLNIHVDLTYSLEAEISTRSDRSFSMYIGGLVGDVDPQATQAGLLTEMIYSGDIVLSSIDYNTNENDTSNYSLYVGGAFGVINRGFDQMYVDANISLIVDPIDVANNVTQTLRFGGFAGLVNTYHEASHIVLEGGTMTLSFDQASTQSRIAPFIGLSRLVVIDGYILNSMTFEGVDIDTSKDLTVLNSMQNFFESEFMNEQLNVS